MSSALEAREWTHYLVVEIPEHDGGGQFHLPLVEARGCDGRRLFLDSAYFENGAGCAVVEAVPNSGVFIPSPRLRVADSWSIRERG